MRQILSGFLATAMIVSVASAMTFAAAPSFEVTLADIDVATFDVTPVGSGVAGKWTATILIKGIVFELSNANGSVGTITIPLNEKFTEEKTVSSDGSKFTYPAVNIPAADIAAKLNNISFSNVLIDGKLYSGKLSASGADVKVTFDDDVKIDYTTVTTTLKTELQAKDTSTDGGTIIDISANAAANYTVGAINTKGTPVSGTGKETSDVEINGDYLKALGIKDVLWCYADGSPVPMAENPYGVDKDLNNENGSQSGTTLYFMINDTVDKKFADDTYWKLKITKGDNAKIIKKITDTTKTFNKTLYDAYKGSPINDVDFTGRHRFIKVELNELYTDDEYKCTLDLRMSPTSKAQSRYEKDGIAIEDAEIKVKDFYFWVKNIVKPADDDWKVGIGGLMLNPLENDWNEVTYFDEDGDLAFMKFFADSDVSKFYAKLSTKWEHADYASYFNDQDAYIFDFVGSPKISATSRCDLQIYNPFVNEDGDETIDPETAVIYQVIDGDLFDVTDNFTYQEGENGDMAFCTRTRFLGTYIICEKAVEEAADTEAPDTDLVPEQEPEEVAPGGSNDGGKAPANTGKYA